MLASDLHFGICLQLNHLAPAMRGMHAAQQLTKCTLQFHGCCCLGSHGLIIAILLAEGLAAVIACSKQGSEASSHVDDDAAHSLCLAMAHHQHTPTYNTL